MLRAPLFIVRIDELFDYASRMIETPSISLFRHGAVVREPAEADA